MQNILFYFKKNGKDFIFLILVLIMLSILVYSTFIKENEEPIMDNSLSLNTNTENINSNMEEPKEESKFFVDIKGAIKTPGVYEVNSSNILNDVIKLAGGFKSDAYKDNINLSKKVKAEMVIYVYTKSEIKKYQEENNKLGNNEICETPDYNIWECTEEKKSIIEVNPDISNVSSSDKDNTSKEKTKVNINTANESELATISGFGPAKAKAIIDYRNKNGKFSKLEDLMNVSGIGEKTFEKIKDSITV